jgi:hypothetical protein
MALETNIYSESELKNDMQELQAIKFPPYIEDGMTSG